MECNFGAAYFGTATVKPLMIASMSGPSAAALSA